MSETKRPLKVFLCHARDDKLKTRELYRYLRKRGIQPWLDAEDLIGGQDWRVEIPKAIKTSDAIIICLSKNSINKEGFVQAEIKFALEKALEVPKDRIFIIPARFEDCDIPSNLEHFHTVDLFEEKGFPKLMKALKTRAGQLERTDVLLPKPNELSPNLGSSLDGETMVNDIQEKIKSETAKKLIDDVEKSGLESPEKDNLKNKFIFEKKQANILMPKVNMPGSKKVKPTKWLFTILSAVLLVTCVFVYTLSLLSKNIFAPQQPLTQTPQNLTAVAYTFAARLTLTAAAFTATPLPPTKTPSISTTIFAPLVTSTSDCNVGQFITDVTIPDGTVMAPGQDFTKKWRVKNVGSCVWSDFLLVFDSGDSMGGPASKTFSTVNPGQEIDLELSLTAPFTKGSYRGYWRILTSNNALVPMINGYQGKNMYLDIVVK